MASLRISVRRPGHSSSSSVSLRIESPLGCQAGALMRLFVGDTVIDRHQEWADKKTGVIWPAWPVSRPARTRLRTRNGSKGASALLCPLLLSQLITHGPIPHPTTAVLFRRTCLAALRPPCPAAFLLITHPTGPPPLSMMLYCTVDASPLSKGNSLPILPAWTARSTGRAGVPRSISMMWILRL